MGPPSSLGRPCEPAKIRARGSIVSWDRPPDLGSRRPRIGLLVSLGFVGLWFGLFPVLILNTWGDCGGPDDVCIAASRLRTEAFLVVFGLVVVASGAALLAVAVKARLWWMLLAVTSVLGLAVSLISLQGREAPPQVAAGAFFLAPGFACLVLGAGVEVWERRRSGDDGDQALRN